MDFLSFGSVFSLSFGCFTPTGSGSGFRMRIRIRIQKTNRMRYSADPDPKHWEDIIKKNVFKETKKENFELWT
jgi:hypothetical protein